MVKVNIGCGETNFGRGWKHVDIIDAKHIDSKDIWLTGFGNNSIKVIYASHFLEYFDRDYALDLLKIWYRKLEEGGKLYLAVPNFDAMATLYKEYHVPLHRFLGPIYGKIKVKDGILGNPPTYKYHKTIYDYASLGDLMKLAGFKRIEEWDQRGTAFDTKDDCSNAEIYHIPISLNLSGRKLE